LVAKAARLAGLPRALLAFLGGTSQILVPDNLRSGVSKAHRYEPDINPSYRDLAEHYGVAVLPARSRKPKDKAKVQVVERWILAVLRNRQFFSLGELNRHRTAAGSPQSQALQKAARLTPVSL
jgi:transposase